ncbi:M15 family metallopeptidase [Mucilaginibacter sp. HMF5004]|uniref:M15 family metallopeptidase n=1 Tax=Mucilaginibacter rivuli TaxID=2857527 RepID=UPI001C5D5936|nr:M15 family metallopeptidase [Mucilaginibacter rivuli]MBW4888242.1 M15 family metallopeptidase [Mucilaginibacter rivuli]
MKKLPVAYTCLYCIAFVLLSISSVAQPPVETGTFKQTDLVELKNIVPNVKLDIRYATKNNFTHRPVYTQARAFLQRPAAIALVKVSNTLKPLGYGLLIFDGYRPWSITKMFWDITPVNKKNFVADPKKGSKHNRGCAVDLSLYDLKTGKEIEMTGAYDEMTERSYPTYTGGTAQQRKIRDLLRLTMEANGFKVNEFEWWHFDYKDWHFYAITNVPFSEIR